MTSIKCGNPRCRRIRQTLAVIRELLTPTPASSSQPAISLAPSTPTLDCNNARCRDAEHALTCVLHLIDSNDPSGALSATTPVSIEPPTANNSSPTGGPHHHSDTDSYPDSLPELAPCSASESDSASSYSPPALHAGPQTNPTNVLIAVTSTPTGDDTKSLHTAQESPSDSDSAPELLTVSGSDTSDSDSDSESYLTEDPDWALSSLQALKCIWL